jgi:predicted DCC family thiol-disulfide oxidoreductase YuxK
MKIILFDGVCKLCNGAVQFIIKRDKHAVFKFAALQSRAGQELSSKLVIDNVDSIIYIDADTVFIKSKAAFEIIKIVGGFWKVLLVFSILPTQLTDFFYDTIAKYRYVIFGKKNSCMLPTKALKSRFLD